MKQKWVLVFLLQLSVTEAAFSVGLGVLSSGGGGEGHHGGDSGRDGGGGGENNSLHQFHTSAASNLTIAYTALQAWKCEIKDDPYGTLNTWVGSNVCAYKGVFCTELQNEMDGRVRTVVAGIDLNHANLQGTLVKQLSLLSDLYLLHLNSNRFTGTIPETFKDLSSLVELDLSNNNFSGNFPTSTLLIPNLIYLDLRFNNFQGPIPREIFNKKLDAIFLNNNQFDNEIPRNIGKSTASVISLANNKLTGAIPFGNCGTNRNLKEILFLSNQLTGCIPYELGLWSGLEVLDLSFNSLMGHLPFSMACLNDIEVLNLGHNKISGVFPEIICSLKRLVNLTVSDNFFSGLSGECGKLFHRNVGFNFSTNCIPRFDLQRPKAECYQIPGFNLSCYRNSLPRLCGGIT